MKIKARLVTTDKQRTNLRSKKGMFMFGRKKPIVFTLLVLALGFGWIAPSSGDEGPHGCQWCEFHMWTPPGGGAPQRLPVCIDWDDGLGWQYCQEIGGTCVMITSCTLFQ